MNILVSTISFLFVTMVGRATYNILFKRFIKSRIISDIDIKYFYPLFSLFFIGNIIIIFNFVMPIKNLVIPIFIFLIGLVVFDIYKNKIKLELNLESFILYLLTPSLLGITSYGVWMGWDTGLYHIPHQLIIRENSIIFGLTNLNIWFGWSSIIEYISSILWIQNNFFMLRILEIIFFCFLFNLLYNFFFQTTNKFYRNIALSIITFAFLDNFGYLGGGNGFVPILSVGKYDAALGILFFILSIMIINSLSKEEYKNDVLIFYMIFSLFAVQIKQTGVYLIFLLLPYIYKFIKINNLKYLKVLRLNLFSISLFFVWIIKNIITTSCLFFPVRVTCLSFLPWAEKVQLNYVEETMIYSPISLSSDLSIGDQFNIWFNFSKNSQFFINFPISLFAITLLFILFFKYQKSEKNNFVNVTFIFFLILNIIFWYLSNYGNVRYGFGLWMLVVAFVAFKFKDSTFKIENLKVTNLLFILVFVGSIAQVPRGYSYESLIEKRLSPYILSIEYGTNYFPSNFGWGVYPETVQCWDIPNCKVEDKDVEPKDYFGTIIFYPDGISGN